MFEKIENYYRLIFCEWNKSTVHETLTAKLLLLYQLIGILSTENDKNF